MNTENIIYNSAGYCRASKEDGDKAESNTIGNQRAMIEEYVKRHPEIRLREMIADDGKSGVSFERPGFQKLLGLVKTGKINCIIVKDLSRLGRNWLEAGQYIQQVFPFFKIRFIAINDNYDSTDGNADIDQVMVPFKNLMNEAYARDASIKTRSVFVTKRNAGEFISPFVPYGYKRSAENKHQLMIDDYAAGIVKDIFSWRLDGMSPGRIAEQLNRLGISSPMEYKLEQGEKYATGFKNKTKAEWNAASVGRILKNEVYIGNLVQGKRTSPNYKVKKVQYKDESEWTRVENTHEPIVSKADFEIVNQLGRYDTRIAPGEQSVYLFSGVVFCGDCKQGMIRKTEYAEKRKYHYYICGTHKADSAACSTHNFSEDKLTNIVLQAVRKQIDMAVEISELLENISLSPMQADKINRIKIEIEQKESEIEKIERRKKRLYDDYADGVLSKDDFRIVNETYTAELKKYRELVEHHREALKAAEQSTDKSEWLTAFTEFRNVQELDRRLIVTLIDKIYVFEGGRIEIVFKYRDKFLEVMKYIREAQEKEAV